MILWVAGSFIILIAVYLVIIGKIYPWLGVIFSITAASVMFSSLNIYLGLFVSLLNFLVLPFINFENGKEKHDEYDEISEKKYLYHKFNKFTFNFISTVSEKYNIENIVIYENTGDAYKLLKLGFIDKFSGVRNIIEKNDGIFTALRQFGNLNLNINDKLLKSNIEYKEDNEKIKIYTYQYGIYLVFVFYESNEVKKEFFDSLNDFLDILNDLKKQIKLKDFKENLLKLSENFNKNLTPEKISDAFVEALKEYPKFDLLFFTEEEDGVQVLKRIEGNEKIKGYENDYVKDENSVVNLVVKNDYPLPGNYKFDSKKNILFGEQNLFSSYKSLIVYPVREQKKVIGTIGMLSKEEYLYDKETVNDLNLMFNMFDIAYFNAKTYKKMAQMATIDGLTGLINHRTFQEKLDEYIARAKRYKKKIAVILSDIDHFKSVNDTYGHPMGDEVLRKVSGVLKKEVRDTDIVARYGGEEFIIIAEGGDKKEIYKMTNRIRDEIKALSFKSGDTEFKVTISMGFAIFPDITNDKQKLIDFSDKALYHSKRNGRDQVNCICDIKK